MQYDKNKNVSLLSAPISIKSLPEVTKVLHLLIATIIKEVDFYYAWTFVVRQCENRNYHIQDIDFDQSYSPVAHSDSFRINIAIAATHRINVRILDVSNVFPNRNFPIHERVCVSTPPYYIDWFEISYPNVPLNRDYGPFFLQCMNGIKGEN